MWKMSLYRLFVFTVVLSEVIQAFSVPENAARMEEARESACNDMGKMLQLVLPVATQIQQEVIKAYGFNNEGEGKKLILKNIPGNHPPPLQGNSEITVFSHSFLTPYGCTLCPWN